jgi:hypothetical protein
VATRHIDSAACEGHCGLAVGVPMRSFREVVVLVRTAQRHLEHSHAEHDQGPVRRRRRSRRKAAVAAADPDVVGMTGDAVRAEG